jgi:large subunit ribosomal protein L4
MPIKMPTAQVYNMNGEAVREQELDPYVFGAPVNKAVLHQVVTVQLTNRRQGTASTKTRAFVSGGNKKPYRQKGTGRARQGSTRAPHFTGGGVVFGPRPHPYERTIPRKVKRLAIRSALSDKVANGQLILVDTLELAEPKTRLMEDFLGKLPLDRHVLILMPGHDETITRATGNIHRARLGHVASINVVQILKYDHLLLPMATVDRIVAMFGRDADDALQMKRHPRVVLRRKAREAAKASGATSGGTRAPATDATSVSASGAKAPAKGAGSAVRGRTARSEAPASATPQSPTGAAGAAGTAERRQAKATHPATRPDTQHAHDSEDTNGDKGSNGGSQETPDRSAGRES